MKYLKLFEDLKSDGYVEISYDDMYDDDNPVALLRFSHCKWNSSELDILKSIDFRENPVLDNGYVVVYMRYQIDMEDREFFVNVYKANDEWFYCISYDWKVGRMMRYYKCDQWDGLMNCLKNEFNLE